jgi:hypothetical protein
MLNRQRCPDCVSGGPGCLNSFSASGALNAAMAPLWVLKQPAAALIFLIAA